jgi:proline iminopeptidase
MGHSFGGIIMTAYAHDYLAHITKMMYVHCTLNMTASLDSHIQNGTMLLKQAGVDYRVDTTLSKFDQMIKVHGELAKQKIEYEIMFRSQKEMDREDSLIDATKPRIIQAFNHFAFKSPEYMKDFAPYTPQITCPVLIIAGTKDYAVGPEAYKSWDFKHKKVVLYNGAHTSYQEEPEWFARVVLGFVK